MMTNTEAVSNDINQSLEDQWGDAFNEAAAAPAGATAMGLSSSERGSSPLAQRAAAAVPASARGVTAPAPKTAAQARTASPAPEAARAPSTVIRSLQEQGTFSPKPMSDGAPKENASRQQEGSSDPEGAASGSCVVEAQQPQSAWGFPCSAPSRRRGRCQPAEVFAWTWGGCTPWARAQASRSAGLRQQQLFQHWSALRQPQAWFWQGKGWPPFIAGKLGIGKPVTAAR